MDDEAHANPVREVGSMLRMLTEIVRGEREKETGLLEQYVCFRTIDKGQGRPVVLVPSSVQWRGRGVLPRVQSHPRQRT